MNVSLIGMSGCGKSVVGERLALRLDMRFFDVDAEIEKEQNMKISEIFDKFGEAEFRRLEREKISRLAELTNAVISTGGGVVLDVENIRALKRSSIVVFIDRSVEDILADLDNSNRPLLRDKSKVRELYDKRIGLYREYADVIVHNVGTVEDVVGKIENLVGTVALDRP